MKTFLNCYWPLPEQAKAEFSKLGSKIQLVTSNKDLDPMQGSQKLVFEQDFEDNIAHLNRSFCELTSLYLVLKNTNALAGNAKLLGLGHYRRWLPLDKSQKAIEELGQDAVLASPIGIGLCKNIYHQYCAAHFKEDFHKLIEATLASNFEWLTMQKLEEWLSLPYLVFPCNLVIAKRETFLSWAADIFKVALPLYKQIDVAGRDNYQKRAMSFLCERLTSLWWYCHTDTLKLACINHIEHLDWKPSAAWDQRGNFTDIKT